MAPDGNPTAFYFPLLLLGLAYGVLYAVAQAAGRRRGEEARERVLDIAFGVALLAVAYTLVLLIISLVTLPDLIVDLVRIVLVVSAFFGVLLAVLFGIFELLFGRSRRTSALAGGRAQRGLQLGLSELVAELLEALGQHPLPGGHDVRHLAVEDLDREAGHGRERRALEHAARAPWTAPCWSPARARTRSPARSAASSSSTRARARHVVGVDPGHVLVAAGHRAADARA